MRALIESCKTLWVERVESGAMKSRVIGAALALALGCGPGSTATRPSAPRATPIASEPLARSERPSASSSPPVAVLVAVASPLALSVDEARTYWIDETQSLFDVSNEGGPPTRRARTRHNPMREPPRLAVDGGVLYWTQNSSDATEPGTQALVRLAADDGEAVSLVALHGSGSLGCLLLEGDDLYWSQDGAVMRRSKQRAKASRIGPVNDLGRGYACLAVDRTNVYAALGSSIGSTSKTGGPQTKLFTVAHVVQDLHVDETSLYWSSGDALFRAPKAARSEREVVVLARAASAVGALAIDEHDLYFTVPGSPTGAADGSVWRVGKDGSRLTRIASGQPSPRTVAVNASSVVWGCLGQHDSEWHVIESGNVSRMLKRP